MSEVLLSEATTEQLSDELFKRVEYGVLCISYPSRGDLYATQIKGTELQIHGSVKVLEMKAVSHSNYLNKLEEGSDD